MQSLLGLGKEEVEGYTKELEKEGRTDSEEYQAGAQALTIIDNSTKLVRDYEEPDDSLIKSLRYVDFPKHFVWKNKKWQPRKRGGEKVIYRMYMCSIQDRERFYLRLLLNHVQGATSYESVCTVDGTLCRSFEEAARQRGLLDEENNEFDKCLEEAARYKMPSQLRRLFASFLLFCDTEQVNPNQLLNKYIKDLYEDYEREERAKHGISNNSDLPANVYQNIIIRKTKVDIEKYLIPYGKKLADYHISKPDDDENVES